MGTARDEAVSQIEAYLRRTLLAMDAGEHWVTVNAGSKTGGEGGGSHVMLDGEGRVVAGMGGKFRGTKVDDIPRKKFINEKAYQRRQESAKKAAASAPKTAQTAPKSAASAPKSAQTAQATAPKLNMHPSLKRNADGSLSAKFTGYPGGEVISRLKEQGFKYDGETKTWTLSKRRATDETVAEVNKAMHDLKPVKNMSFAERSPYESIRPNWLHDAPPQASGPISKPATKIGSGTIANQNKALELAKLSDGSTRMTVDFGGYPGREVIDKLKANGFKYDGDTRTWSARTTDSTKVNAVNDILNGHFGGGSGASKVAPQVMSKLTSAGVTESSSQPGHFYLPRESYGNYEEKDKAFNDLFGLKISRHSKGRVSGAELDGQKISNSQATHLLSQSSYANFNASTGKWEGLDPELQKVWDKRHGGGS